MMSGMFLTKAVTGKENTVFNETATEIIARAVKGLNRRIRDGKKPRPVIDKLIQLAEDQRVQIKKLVELLSEKEDLLSARCKEIDKLSEERDELNARSALMSL